MSGEKRKFKISATGPDGLGLRTKPRNNLNLHPGESATIMVEADSTVAAGGWNFASLNLESQDGGPDLHMPIAVLPSTATNGSVFSKTVDAATAAEGEPLNYQVNVINGQLTGPIEVVDVMPKGVEIVPGSLSSVIINGTTIDPFHNMAPRARSC